MVYVYTLLVDNNNWDNMKQSNRDDSCAGPHENTKLNNYMYILVCTPTILIHFDLCNKMIENVITGKH